MADIWCYKSGGELLEFATTIPQAMAMFHAATEDGTVSRSRDILFAVHQGDEQRVEPVEALGILHGIVKRLSAPGCPLMFIYSGRHVRASSQGPRPRPEPFSRGRGWLPVGERIVFFDVGPGRCDVIYRWGDDWKHEQVVDGRSLDRVALNGGDEVRFKKVPVDAAIIYNLNGLIAFIEEHRAQPIFGSVRRGPP